VKNSIEVTRLINEALGKSRTAEQPSEGEEAAEEESTETQ
jgi:hypothetical protein